MSNYTKQKEPFTGHLSGYCKKIEHVGSRVVCNPAPTDTDDDWLCLVENESLFNKELQDTGWSPCAQYGTLSKNQFMAWRKGHLNIIATKREKFFDDFCLATEVCKSLNLLNKDDRIKVFKVVCPNEQENK
jgi:hypothetical protein